MWIPASETAEHFPVGTKWPDTHYWASQALLKWAHKKSCYWSILSRTWAALMWPLNINRFYSSLSLTYCIRPHQSLFICFQRLYKIQPSHSLWPKCSRFINIQQRRRCAHRADLLTNTNTDKNKCHTVCGSKCWCRSNPAPHILVFLLPNTHM